ncbi:MAG TPA: hypothetical protein PK349_11250 [Candidatus Hydrogenedentes bacterium]|nr:hypothetical protein [Candidatus Hydrogenedentota bacterium]
MSCHVHHFRFVPRARGVSAGRAGVYPLGVVLGWVLLWAGGIAGADEVSSLSRDGAMPSDAVTADAGAPARDQVTVILLHGMGRSRAALWMLDTRLRQAGFHTLSYAYSARAEDIEVITDEFLKFIRANLSTPVYHVVAHSHANIVARLAFRRGYPPGLGRLVMIAPPNHPHELARTLRDNPIYQWVTGESARVLASEAFFDTLPVPTVPFGVIAGNRGQRLTLGEPNDGVITVASTRLEGMADWTVLPYAHNFLVTSREVAYHVIRFLETGRFATAEELSRELAGQDPVSTGTGGARDGVANGGPGNHPEK